jgi:NDP-sugar pyrophosphorylase family protein
LPFLRSGLVLLLNGESFCDVDLASLLHFHKRSRAAVSLTLCRVMDSSRWGRARVARDGRIVRLEEKGSAHGRGWVNAGVCLIKRDLVADLPPSQSLSLERDLLPGWAAKGKVFGYRRGGRFLDLATPESSAEAGAYFRETPVSFADVG